MSQGVWVELTFAGDVSPQTAEAFVERTGAFAARFGLRLALGAVHGPEEDFPGSPLLLDEAVKEMAQCRGISQQEALQLLTDRARGQNGRLT